MIRRVAVISLVLAAAVSVAGCGHQVTPSPTTSDLSGDVVVNFRVNGQLNFTSYTYAIIIDTCGNGTPLPNAYATTFTSYSYAFLLGGAAAGVSSGNAVPELLQYILTPGTASNALNPQVVPLNPSSTNVELNSNGQGTQFQLTFSRAQLANPLGVAEPCPVTSGAVPSPAPTNQATWAFNFFTLDATSKTVIDSLGIGGPTDNTYSGAVINTAVASQNQITKVTGGPVPSDPSAAIAGGEIDNYI